MTALAVGRANRAQGIALEDALDAKHAVYATQRMAHMTRISTPVTVPGRTTADARGRACFQACFAARSGVDFVGWATVSGVVLPVVPEAKTHSGDDSWDSGLIPDYRRGVGGRGLTEEQADHLRAYGDGCVSLVVLRPWGETWRIGFADLAAHVERADRRTVRPGDVETVGVRLVGVDWLGVG